MRAALRVMAFLWCVWGAGAGAVDLQFGDLIVASASVQPALLRLDPETLAADEITSPTRGAGPPLATPAAVAVAVDGSILVATTMGIVQVDPASGDRRALTPVVASDLGVGWIYELVNGRHSLPGPMRLFALTSAGIGQLDLAAGQLTGLSGAGAGVSSFDVGGAGVLALRMSSWIGGYIPPAYSPVSLTGIPSGVRAFTIDAPGNLSGAAVHYALSDTVVAVRSGRARAMQSGATAGSGPQFVDLRAIDGSPSGYLFVADEGSEQILRVHRFSGAREAVLAVDRPVDVLSVRLPAAPVLSDQDGDGVPDWTDVCVATPDPDQVDSDSDGVGDLCNDRFDSDGDELADGLDTCLGVVDPANADLDSDGIGDLCNDAVDRDGDDIADDLDNCPDTPNSDQLDTDRDGYPDACNDAVDRDRDDFADTLDNCPDVANPNQVDSDGDRIGDACNEAVDPDGDEFAGFRDNCPQVFNPEQLDRDRDRLGDACDPFPERWDNYTAQLEVDLGTALAQLASAQAAAQEAQAALGVCLARRFFEDADADGEEDSRDLCPDTASGEAVDGDGCSLAQFCANAGPWRLVCARADWRNDESLVPRPRDCALTGHHPSERVCAPAPQSAETD